jgi:hypothetical protein
MRVAQLLFSVFVLVACTLAQTDKSQRPSAPGTAEMTLNGKKISVEYSRPKIRDPKSGQPRKIMGGLVPYGQVWRAGANEATTLKTEGNLDVNGALLPAGTYTLFAIPEMDKCTLVISKKTGEWGIPYPGQSDDFARVPMKLEHLEQLIDPFTITLEPPRADQLPLMGVGSGAAPARLCLEWEHARACVDLRAK